MIYQAIVAGSIRFFNKDGAFLGAAVSFYSLILALPILGFLTSLILIVSSLFPFQPNQIDVMSAILPPHLLQEFHTHLGGAMNKKWVGITSFILAYLTSFGLFRALSSSLATLQDCMPWPLIQLVKVQLRAVPFGFAGLLSIYVVSVFISQLLGYLSSIGYLSGNLMGWVVAGLNMALFVINVSVLGLSLFMVYHFFSPLPSHNFKATALTTSIVLIGLGAIKLVFAQYLQLIGVSKHVYGAFFGLFGFCIWMWGFYSLVLWGGCVLFHLNHPHFSATAIPDSHELLDQWDEVDA